MNLRQSHQNHTATVSDERSGGLLGGGARKLRRTEGICRSRPRDRWSSLDRPDPFRRPQSAAGPSRVESRRASGPIHDQCLAGHPFGVIAGEKQRHRGDVVGKPGARIGLMGAIASGFQVHSVGVRLMERRKVDVPSNFDSRLSVFPLPTAVLRTVSFSGRVYKLTASFSRRVRLADRPLKPQLALSIVYFHNLR